jgi:hypothetical protein
VLQLVRIACWQLPLLPYQRFVMQLVKVRSCTDAKVIYESVSPLPNVYQVCVTLFLSVRL